MEQAEQTEQEMRDELTKEIWEGVEVDKAPEPEPEVDGPEPEPEDPYAGLPDAVKDKLSRVDALESRLSDYDAIANRLKQAESRIGSITNQLHQAKQAAEDVKKAPTETEIAAAAASDKEWEELKDDFPEWASAMDKRLGAERQKAESALAEIKETIKVLQTPKEDKTQELETRISRMREELLLEVRHPGWQTTAKSPEFVEFFKTLPADKQAKAGSDKAVDAIEILDLFRESKTKKSPSEIAKSRQQRLSQSQLPSSGQKSTPKKSVDDMTDEEYRQYLAKEIWQN